MVSLFVKLSKLEEKFISGEEFVVLRKGINAMQHRFRFLGALDPALQMWVISDDEFFHAKKVLRLTAGAQVEVFDGQGAWGEGVIVEMRKDCALVELAQVHKEPNSQVRLIIATGALQTQTMSDLLPCLVELGADEVHVFLHEGVAKTRLNDKTTERWQKILIAAAKQSKRAHLPTLHGWSSFASFLDYAGALEQRCILDPEATRELSDLSLKTHASICLLLGGEKGLSQTEQQHAHSAGFEGFRLGSNILRSFTAAVAGTAILSSKRAAAV